MSKDSIRIGKAELEAFVSAIFVKTGLSREHADAWAKMLVWANLRGTDSHGVIRIPRYIDLVQAKSINAKPDMRVTRKPGAAAIVLEADRAPAAVALTRAVAEAVAAAREVGVGWCAARHITHTGAIGYFALQVAEAGMAGIVLSASGPMMIYPGTRVAAVSSNPIAFAIPRRNGRPYLLDFSTGVVANGKIMAAADRGEKIPLGWGVDKDGRDTTDPKAVENVLPMAGAKGRGLVVHDRVPDQLAAFAATHRSRPGELGDRRRSIPQRLGGGDRSGRVRRPRQVPQRGRAARQSDRGPRPRRRRRQDHAPRRTRRCDTRRARDRGHSHPEGHVATYRQGRDGARRDAAEVMGWSE